MRNLVSILVVSLFAALTTPLVFASSPERSASNRAKPPTFSVQYSGAGRMSLFSLVRQPNAGSCNITSSEKTASISNISWRTIWRRVPLARTSGRAAASATIEGVGKNDAANIYDLSGCQSGYSVNNCVAPSACSEDAGSCQSKDLYQTPGYPVMITVSPDRKKRGRWLVVVAAEGAAFSPCASGVINNSFFEESPTTARFYVTASKTRKTSVIRPPLIATGLDCSETVPGLDFRCRIDFDFSTRIEVTGNVTASRL